MAGELAAEWIKIPDGNGNLQKVWVRDSTARREIAQLQTDVGSLVIPDPSDAAPQMDGTAAAGSSADYSRADHVHPTDTSRQATLSQNQLAAVNSGITATKVATYDAIQVPTKTSELTNDSGFITSADVPPGSTASSTTPKMDGTASVGTETAFARGDHRHPTDTSRQAALNTAQMAAVNSGITSAKVAGYDAIEVPTKTSELTNDSGYITAASLPTASSASPAMDGTASPGSSTAWARGDHVHPHDSTKADVSAIPTKTSDLTNDSGFITSAPVSSVNGQTGAVSLDASDVGALPDSTTIPSKTSQLTNDSGFLTSAPVTSVNTKTGAVNLTASDVGALPSSTAIPSKTSDLTNDSGFITASAVPSPSSAAPSMDGTAAAGTSANYARADHVHPSDTAKQDALTSSQLAAVNSGITADDLAVNDASVLCTVTPIEPTLLGSYTHYDTLGRCWYYKIGHRVHVHVGVGGLTSGTSADLWYMPTGYRPYSIISNVGTGGSMTTYGRLRINAEGRVFINANATYACVDIEYDAFQ